MYLNKEPCDASNVLTLQLLIPVTRFDTCYRLSCIVGCYWKQLANRLQVVLLLPWFNSMDNNYIHYTLWDEITYPFSNFNGATVEVWNVAPLKFGMDK